MNESDAKTARAIKAQMKKQGLSLLGLADKAKIHPDTLSKIFSGDRGMSVRMLHKIAKGLGIKPAELVK